MLFSPGKVDQFSRRNPVVNTYYWFRVVCVHILPCTSLVVLNSALVGAIRTAQRRRSELLHRRANRSNTAATASDGGGTRLLRADGNQASTSETTRRPHGSARGARARRLPARPHSVDDFLKIWDMLLRS